MDHFDVIWIGTGQATATAVPRLSAAGKTVAVVERGRFGGSCVNYGCTPTKTLVASARAAHMARRGPDFGIGTGEVTVDFQAVMKRMNAVRNEGSEGLESWLEGMDGVALYRDHARFIDDHSIAVGDATISGDTMVIHVGARAIAPSIPGIEEIEWLDSAGLLDLASLPKHLLVVGGSYIGLEFSQVFRRLGSQVTVLERGSQIMFREDEDIAASAKDFLQREGIVIKENSEITRLEKTAAGFTAFVKADGKDESIDASHLLVGVGRAPNSDSLDLGKAGVHVDERGYITVDEFGRSSASHIYALGDVNGRGAFTHSSVNDGQVFLDHYFRGGDRRIPDRHPIYALYTDPPLGRIGINEKDAGKSDGEYLMATMPMSGISRAREKSETAGLVKIIVDKEKNTIAGVSLLGVGGDEIISMFAPLVYEGISVDSFRKMVLPHPTVAELMPWVLDNLAPLSQNGAES